MDHELDLANWVFLTRQSSQSEDATRVLARSYGMEFTQTDDGQQMHGVVTHVIDRNGCFAAKFHGLRFSSVNLVLYVNGLINNSHLPKGTPGPGYWERWRAIFR